MIRNKTIKFNMDKLEDRKLWEFLSGLPHGIFSELTKQFWELKKDVAFRDLEERMKSGKISMVYGHHGENPEFIQEILESMKKSKWTLKEEHK